MLTAATFLFSAGDYFKWFSCWQEIVLLQQILYFLFLLQSVVGLVSPLGGWRFVVHVTEHSAELFVCTSEICHHVLKCCFCSVCSCGLMPTSSFTMSLCIKAPFTNNWTVSFHISSDSGEYRTQTSSQDVPNSGAQIIWRWWWWPARLSHAVIEDMEVVAV